ncbi:hypothetical protein DFQ27_000097 [Actinomortierella ambigua]|uniref:Wax synthase domain-containing protein n=1 Tax=Actinomortierella ambigua TaxID=1343610 RepID=A0A9P6QIZ6_9FUNG|nr:hypothetical protein DFQ27_000097 [Actinomortierella ambigua]
MNTSSRPMHDLWFDPYGYPPCSGSYKSRFFPSCTTVEPFNPLTGIFISWPTSIYMAIHTATTTALYQLLLSKHLSSRAKQIAALPLLAWLLVMPVFFTPSNRLFHLISAVTSGSSAMRFIDLYYLKPWTGMRSYYNGQLSAYRTKCENTVVVGDKNEDKNGKDSDKRLRSRLASPTSNTSGASDQLRVPHDSGQRMEASKGVALDEWLMWDKERMHIEMWAPVRRLANVGSASGDAPTAGDQGVHWTSLLPIFLIYAAVSDIILYVISEVRVAVVERMSNIQYLLFICAGGGVITLNMLWFFYIVLFAWAILTGQRVRASEWTMINHRFPLFATDPSDFWSQWHTLFRYIWVDLAFFPIRRFAQLYLGPQRTGSKAISKALEGALPVLGVFVLSATLHGYIVWSTWRLSPVSQWVYFIIQGLAVVATRGFQQTKPGQRWCRYYYARSEQERKWLDRVGMLAMVGYHALTAPIFIEPYVRHALWLDVRPRSVLWLLFGKL